MCGLVVYHGAKSELPEFEKNFQNIVHRGPDNTQIKEDKGVTFAFHRLSIMDLSNAGNQPFVDNRNNNMAMCNGEIYNFEFLKAELKTRFNFQSGSDCEVILPLYEKYGLIESVKKLDGEFAVVIFDHAKNELYAARDPMGIRPLFYGHCKKNKKIMFSSEMKSISDLCDDVNTFPPGHVFDGKNFIAYIDVWKGTHFHNSIMDDVLKNIKEKLVAGVLKRLHSDAPVGFLLSGGLDSSLVCAISHRFSKTHLGGKKLKTFCIGMDENPIDLKYAKTVAEFLGSEHHEVIMDKNDVLNAVKDVIWHLETWDITTVRASIGMYLCCKYIHEKTDVKVLLTGEVSDELFGYKYTDFAPNAREFQLEAEKRIRELYVYDVLRADRCIAANSLEARVPFSDTDFVQYVMNIDPELKMNKYNMGKYLLRKAFDDGSEWLPHSILYRDKAAFSDAVGHSMVDYLKEKAESLYTDEDVKNAGKKYPHGTPFTKESLWYRDIFESFYPNRSKLIFDFWMPNKTWEGCNVNDPSARVLKNYGKAGE